RLARYPRSGKFLTAPVFSNDLRYCVGLIYDRIGAEEEGGIRRSIVVVDLADARELTIPLTESPDQSIFAFSPTADIFAHFVSPQEEDPGFLSIYDRSGKLLDRRPSRQLVVPITDSYLVHVNSHADVELWGLATQKPVATLSEPGWDA